MAKIFPKNSKGVLVIMTDYHLGDFAICLRVIDAFAGYFDGGIDLVVTSAFAPLISMLPNSDKIRLRIYKEKKKQRDLIQYLRFVAFSAGLFMSRYKLVFGLSYRLKCSMFALFTAAKDRVGFSLCKRSWVYTDVIEGKSDSHKIAFYSSILKRIGIDGVAPEIKLQIPAADKAVAGKLLDEQFSEPTRKLALMHPLSGQSHRTWSGVNFAATAREAIQKWNMNVVLVGSPSERTQLERIAGLIDEPGKVTVVTRNFGVLLAIAERAAIMISNLSGPTHLAAVAMDIPIVAISGPTKQKWWQPLSNAPVNLLRHGCEQGCPSVKNCKLDFACVKQLSVSEMLSAIEAVMHQTDRKSQSS